MKMDNRISSHKQSLGHKGEMVAAEFLEKKGFSIIMQNFRFRSGEIDIISKDNDTIVFVEVKSASSGAFGHPAEWVDEKKQSHLISTAKKYLFENNIHDVPVRFDVITVDFKNKKIDHFVNAFYETS